MAASNEPDDKQRAFYTILAGAVLIDSKFRPLELQELEALTNRCKTLSKLPEGARDALRTDVVGKLRKCFESPNTRYDRISDACRSLREMDKDSTKPLRHSILLHALDLAHADDHLTSKKRNKETGLHDNEVEYFRELAQMLELDWHAGHSDEYLIRVKNSL